MASFTPFCRQFNHFSGHFTPWCRYLLPAFASLPPSEGSSSAASLPPSSDPVSVTRWGQVQGCRSAGREKVESKGMQSSRGAEVPQDVLRRAVLPYDRHLPGLHSLRGGAAHHPSPLAPQPSTLQRRVLGPPPTPWHHGRPWPFTSPTADNEKKLEVFKSKIPQVVSGCLRWSQLGSGGRSGRHIFGYFGCFGKFGFSPFL